MTAFVSPLIYPVLVYVAFLVLFLLVHGLCKRSDRRRREAARRRPRVEIVGEARR